MRTFRFIIMFVIAAGLALGLATSTHADVDGDGLQAVYPNKIVPGINKPCDRGFDKLVRASLSVPRQGRIGRYDTFVLQLKGGEVVFDDSHANRVDKRHLEYYIPLRKRQKVLLNDMTRSLAYVRLRNTYEYTFVLEALCMSRVP